MSATGPAVPVATAASGDPLRPTSLEIASCSVTGSHREDATGAGARGPRAPALTAREAIERAVLPALQRQPCLVAFSGGRDSSAVLAVAALVARRHGLALPVPVTYRFEGLSETNEDRWQEQVVRHLGLPDWEVARPGSDLEVIGPAAASLLRRDGVRWPPNRHFVLLVARMAAGGSVLTGVDGDGLFDRWRWRHAMDVLSRRRPPTGRDILSAALALSPRPVRAAILGRRSGLALPWLLDGAARRVHGRQIEEWAGEPRRWDRRLRWYASRRYVAMFRENARSLGALAGATAVPLFLDPGFLDAVGREGGRTGFGDRTRAMGQLFGDLLPEPVLARSSKAEFTRVFWGEACAEFARTWTGEGVDHDLVDAAALARTWKEGPGATALGATGLLLQSAWLTSHAARR